MRLKHCLNTHKSPKTNLIQSLFLKIQTSKIQPSSRTNCCGYTEDHKIWRRAVLLFSFEACARVRSKARALKAMTILCRTEIHRLKNFHRPCPRRSQLVAPLPTQQRTDGMALSFGWALSNFFVVFRDELFKCRDELENCCGKSSTF